MARTLIFLRDENIYGLCFLFSESNLEWSLFIRYHLVHGYDIQGTPWIFAWEAKPAHWKSAVAIQDKSQGSDRSYCKMEHNKL